MTERTFDWKPRFDPRSRNYPVSAILATSIRRRNKLWKVGPILDQGSEGACVGFGWTDEAFANPVAVHLDWMANNKITDPYEFALDIYHFAQQIDEWEGEDYEGTSVLAGAKAMQSRGLLKEYRWAFNVEEVADAVLAKGPVVIGIPWYSDMYSPVEGVLRVSGQVVGGHCVLVVGYRLADPRLGGDDGFVIQNSWGPGWGDNGLAVIRKSDLDFLLSRGEACVPTIRSYGRRPFPARTSL